MLATPLPPGQIADHNCRARLRRARSSERVSGSIAVDRPLSHADARRDTAPCQDVRLDAALRMQASAPGDAKEFTCARIPLAALAAGRGGDGPRRGLAGAGGLEPPSSEPKSEVLPLDDAPQRSTAYAARDRTFPPVSGVPLLARRRPQPYPQATSRRTAPRGGGRLHWRQRRSRQARRGVPSTPSVRVDAPPEGA